MKVADESLFPDNQIKTINFLTILNGNTQCSILNVFSDREKYSDLAMSEAIRLLEMHRTGEMEQKCLTRDEFLSLLSESNLPFR